MWGGPHRRHRGQRHLNEGGWIPVARIAATDPLQFPAGNWTRPTRPVSMLVGVRRE